MKRNLYYLDSNRTTKTNKMKKEDIIKCLQKATKKNVTEKGVEWKLLYEDGSDAILKLAEQPDASRVYLIPEEKIDELSLILANHDFDSNIGKVIMPLKVCKQIVRMITETLIVQNTN